MTAEEKAVVARFEELDAAISRALLEAADSTAPNPELEQLRGEMRALKSKYPYLYREAFGMRQPS